jgi:hypothetical protein
MATSLKVRRALKKIREDKVGSPCLDENLTKSMDIGAKTAISGDGGDLLNYPSAEELIAKARALVKREYIRFAPVSLSMRRMKVSTMAQRQRSMWRKNQRGSARERKEVGLFGFSFFLNI